MSVISSTHTGRNGLKQNIEKWLNNVGIHKYKLKEIKYAPYFTIDVIDENVNFLGLKLEELPSNIVFSEIVGGSFIASYSEFVSMKGFPKKVGGNFDISYSKIKTLDYVPELVDKDFLACRLPFAEQQIRETTKVTCNVYI